VENYLKTSAGLHTLRIREHNPTQERVQRNAQGNVGLTSKRRQPETFVLLEPSQALGARRSDLRH
jgi:hypothetical protein